MECVNAVIFASGVNFSIFIHFLCFFLLKLLKLDEIDGVKFLAWKSGGVEFLTNSMSEDPQKWLRNLCTTLKWININCCIVGFGCHMSWACNLFGRFSQRMQGSEQFIVAFDQIKTFLSLLSFLSFLQSQTIYHSFWPN